MSSYWCPWGTLPTKHHNLPRKLLKSLEGYLVTALAFNTVLEDVQAPNLGSTFPAAQVIGEHPGDHNHQDFSKSTAIQMGGVLQYKWHAYCDTNGRSTDSISLSLEPRGTKSTAIQMGGVLRYKWEVYCDTFLRSSGGWGF